VAKLGEGRGGEWCSHPRQQKIRSCRMGPKINVTIRKIDFLPFTDFKLIEEHKRKFIK
jgi:hypothetical protein